MKVTRNYLKPTKADEWRNFAGSYETMQADIEELKNQTPETDPAKDRGQRTDPDAATVRTDYWSLTKAIDLATQIIAQEQLNLKRFDEIKRRLSSLEVGLPDDVAGDFEVLKAKVEQLETESSELDLKTIDRINELGSRIGTQVGFQNDAFNSFSIWTIEIHQLENLS